MMEINDFSSIFADFRTEFLGAIGGVQSSASKGYFINSCYAHCQTEMQETWLRADSPVLDGKVRCFLLSFVASSSVHYPSY